MEILRPKLQHRNQNKSLRKQRRSQNNFGNFGKSPLTFSCVLIGLTLGFPSRGLAASVLPPLECWGVWGSVWSHKSVILFRTRSCALLAWTKWTECVFLNVCACWECVFLGRHSDTEKEGNLANFTALSHCFYKWCACLD